ncbi:MAG: hypothetical protein ACYCZU_07495 [Devosia sp.]
MFPDMPSFGMGLPRDLEGRVQEQLAMTTATSPMASLREQSQTNAW